jgi:DNA repair exonuclease SbcCD nuclease subunit
MIKLVHAADFHLDSPFSALSAEQAAQRRAEQRQMLERLADFTNDFGAELLLLAGDLFDSALCYAESEECICRALGRVKARVFISPGNHDYYSPRSPWARMTLPENVHVFTSPAPQRVELPELGCAVWGAAFTGERIAPSLGGFRASGALDIMVMHGDTENAASPYGFISEEMIAASGLSYLALGHIHAASGLRRAGNTFYAYPGCPIGRGFDETGEKGVLAGEISAEGCRMDFVPLGARKYEIRSVDISAAEDASAVEALLRAEISGGERDIWRLVLTGEHDGAVDVRALAEALEPSCCAVQIKDRTRPKTSLWSALDENTLKGVFLRRMKEIYDSAEGEAREKALLAARFGLAALENREEVRL